MCNWRNNERSREFDSTREVYKQINNLANSSQFKFAPVHAMSWMPDLTVFCPLFSGLKDFKIPPARILQSCVLDSKVINAFSALSFA